VTKTQYRKHNGDFFRGRKARLTLTIRNKGGDVIYAGESVRITGKSGRGGFNIAAEGKRAISRVDYTLIELVETKNIFLKDAK
jgi:hypothetical protein